MNAFFPVGGVSLIATTVAGTVRLPTGGPMIRIARETSTERVSIVFGGANISDTSVPVELASGVVEMFDNFAGYDRFQLSTESGTCGVNITCGPRYAVPRRGRK